MENQPDLHIPPPPRPRRSRWRTPVLLLTAVLLGAAGGIAGGYTVQAEREPTLLPPLSQAKLGTDHNPQVSDAEAPRNKIAGDLRKLLISKPKGTQRSPESPQGAKWLPMYELADAFDSPRYLFKEVADYGLRRSAMISWERGYQNTYVRLTQYRDETVSGSDAYLVGQLAYLPDSDHAGNLGEAIPGSTNGRYFVFDKPERKPGYLPVYEAHAVARRGSVVMAIFIYDTKPISESYVRSLAKKQLERL